MANPKASQKQGDRFRNAEIAKIHIGASALGIEGEAYREMLKEYGGSRSCSDMTPAGRRAVLKHLHDSGFNRKFKGRPKNMDTPIRTSRTAQLEKIEALLTVGSKPWSYADALAKRICKVDKIIWVEAENLYKVITALRKQAIREGWDLSGEI